MKYFFVLMLLFSSLGRAEVRSKNFEGFEQGQSAISFFLGQPTFLRYDYWINWKTALFLDVGFHFDKYYYAAIDYTFYFSNTRDFLKKERNFWNSILFYLGPGFFTGFASEDNADDSFKMGLRAFGGAEYLFDGNNYGIRAELGPAIFLQGDSFIGIQGAVGITYYFGNHDKNKSIVLEEDAVEPAPKKATKKKSKKIKKSSDADEFDEF